MTPQDREELQALRQTELSLRQSLENVTARLDTLEKRLAALSELPPVPPPLADNLVPIVRQPLPNLYEEAPPLPGATIAPPPPPRPTLPPVPAPPKEIPAVPRESLESKLGRWLPRLGVVLFILFLVSLGSYAYWSLSAYLGPWIKLAVLGLLSGGFVALGLWLEKKGGAQLVFGRTLAAGGLAGLYYVLYAAYEIPGLQVIHGPILAGTLLLLWSAGVFYLADLKKSQLLSLFAVVLAYFSSGLNPVGGFTLVANLLLAVTAVVFLLRNAWASLGTISLIATYLTAFRRLVLDQNGSLILLNGGHGSFLPQAGYLLGAWTIFTAAVFLSRQASFTAGKRLAFLSLNNGALAFLLTAQDYYTGYMKVGWCLLANGGLYLAASLLARLARADAGEVIGAYLAQGLVLITGGLMAAYTGATRGILLGLESVFIEMAGAYSRSPILRITAYISSFLALIFISWEISFTDHHVWLLSLGGAAALLLNAWMSRWDVPLNAEGRARLVLSASYYIILALGLIYLGCATEMSANRLPPALALMTLGLTFSIYLVKLYELPPLAQLLLVIAQAYAIFPPETGEPRAWWSSGIVAAVTLLLSAWWPRETVTRRGAWLIPLNFYYAIAMIGLTQRAFHPLFNEQGWLMFSGLLSVAFLLYGFLIRSWPFALVGQFFLLESVLGLVYLDTAAIAWWAALAPIALVFATARGTHQWLNFHPEKEHPFWRGLAYGYQIVALLLSLIWINHYISTPYQSSAALLLGSLVLLWNVVWPSRFGLRVSYVASLAGVLAYFAQEHNLHRPAYDAAQSLGLFLLLLQPLALTRRKNWLSSAEIWAWLLVAVLTGWAYVSDFANYVFGWHQVTIGWALFALLLVLLGLVGKERRYRLLGLFLLLLTIGRVLVIDIWSFSSGEQVLTLLVLTVVTLGLGYLYARFAEQLKQWL